MSVSDRRQSSTDFRVPVVFSKDVRRSNTDDRCPRIDRFRNGFCGPRGLFFSLPTDFQGLLAPLRGPVFSRKSVLHPCVRTYINIFVRTKTVRVPHSEKRWNSLRVTFIFRPLSRPYDYVTHAPYSDGRGWVPGSNPFEWPLYGFFCSYVLHKAVFRKKKNVPARIILRRQVFFLDFIDIHVIILFRRETPSPRKRFLGTVTTRSDNICGVFTFPSRLLSATGGAHVAGGCFFFEKSCVYFQAKENKRFF